MQSGNRFFDDIARVASGALGAAAGMREEVETLVRDRVQRILDDMDLVRREEFEVVREMLVRSREEQEALLLRVDELERKLAGGAGETASQGRLDEAPEE